MRSDLVFFLAILFFVSCNTSGEKAPPSLPAEKQPPAGPVAVYDDFSLLEPVLESHNDTTYVVNFWATSCKPCIKEMPHFEKLHQDYNKEKVRILLVSLDLKRHAHTRVDQFLKKMNIQNEVILLADQDYSKWTEKIDSSWYGALPATLIFKDKKRKFQFGAFETYDELESAVSEVMKSPDVN